MTYPIPRASIWPNVVFDTSSAKGMTAAQAWVAGLAPGSPVEPRDDANSTQGPLETKRSAQDVRHGDTWEVRNGRGAVVASNDWPAPKPGTHESDLPRRWANFGEPLLPGESDRMAARGGMHEYLRARAWSQANATTEDTSQ